MSDLPQTIRAFEPHVVIAPLPTRVLRPPMTLDAALEEPERQIIEAALLRNDWSRQAAARELGIDRTTLYKKMRKHGLGGARASDAA